MLIEAISLKKGCIPKWPEVVTKEHVAQLAENYGDSITDKDKNYISDSIFQLTEDIAELKRQLDGDYSREMTGLSYPERDIWLTGGMSCGDEPTDLFEVIQRLRASGILEEAGFE